jgi:environmental stress-induced protein Ves
MSIEVPPGSVLRFAELRPGPWRNGAGTTREIASGGQGIGDFDWRLSLADVDRSGAFSLFPGARRILTVIQGEEIVLTLEGRDQRVRQGQPFHFPGGASVTARLPAGAVRVLNVVTSPEVVRAEVSVLELVEGQYRDLPADRFAVVVSGRAALYTGSGETPLLLHDTVRGAGFGKAALTGGGVIAEVRLTKGKVHGQDSARHL